MLIEPMLYLTSNTILPHALTDWKNISVNNLGREGVGVEGE